MQFIFPRTILLVKSLLDNSEYVMGKQADLGGFIAAGDNYFFNKKGIPSIMYGPGTLDCIHNANEWVSIEELVEAAKDICSYGIKCLRMIINWF